MSEHGLTIPVSLDPQQLPLGLEIAGGTAGPAMPASRLRSMERSFAPAVLLKWIFSFPAMLGAVLVGRVFYEGRAFLVDPDLWWHIETGRRILASHHWPTTDPYSSTVAGQPWIACEWLGEVMLAAVQRLAGVLGLDVFLIVWASIVMLLIYYYATLRSGNSKAGFVTAAFLCSFAFASFTLRPQMIAYLYLVLTLIALELFRQGQRRAIWLLPPLFLLWVNTHGSWIIGLGIVFVTLVGGFWEFRVGGVEARRWSAAERIQLELVLLASLAAIPLTPYGTEVAAYPFEVAAKLPLGVANVVEWQSMPFNILGGKLFLALLLGFIAVQVLCAFVWRLDELALLLFGTMMACLHVRFLLIFVPLFAPIMATILARWLPPYAKKKDQYALNAILMTGVLVCLVWYFPSKAQIEDRIAKEFPVGTTAYLAAHPIPGRLFNDYGFGGYLVGARQRVFVDGRSDPYERGGALSDYFHITQLKPGALRLLDAYNVTACLLQPDGPLAAVLGGSAEWKRVASDRVSVLFTREEPLARPSAVQRPPATGGRR
jgi:hypothetical protein